MYFSKDVLGANIRAERARCDLSQEELAARCGVSVPSIAAYENGTYVPGVDKVAAIANVLGVTPNALLGWEGGSSNE